MPVLYTTTIEITDRHGASDTCIHIPTPNIDMGGFQTLCGWCDVGLKEHDYELRPANCKQCIAVLKAIREMTFPKSYFAK